MVLADGHQWPMRDAGWGKACIWVTGLPGVLEKRALKRLKSRAPAKGGFEVFPYWSKRFEAVWRGEGCVLDRINRINRARLKAEG